MTTYRYLTVEEWGGKWVRPPVAEKLLDQECYVHHSAGNHPTDAIAAFLALNAYATRPKDQGGKGYSFLDYDILIHYDRANDLVTIGEGRGKWLSAATKDRNEEGEAVCVLGYFHPGHSLSRQPYPEELEGTARGIVYGMDRGWISRDTVILGHRDNPAHPGATGCPGDYLYDKLPIIRTRVAQLLGGSDVIIEHPNRRLLDTRTIEADAARLPGAFAISVPEGNGAIDMELNVQVVQAQGDGWISTNGRSALVYDSGRANATISIPPATGIDLRINGGKTHVIVDLTKVVR